MVKYSSLFNIVARKTYNVNLNDVIPLCICIFTLLLYLTVNTTIIEYNINATGFDLQ